jgi:hypothetical protein
MMEKFLKPFYLFASGIAFGFGTALTLSKIIVLAEAWQWTLASFVFALGGFLLALGFIAKKSDDNDKGGGTVNP